MKIKSWTGNEVEARSGMVCKLEGADGFWVITDIISTSQIRMHQCYSLCGRKIHNTMTAMMSKLTMLHCPFQVGDEYEVYREGLCGFPDHWFGGNIFDNQEDADMANAGKFTMQRRHANPDLRTSPEYKI